MTGGNGEDTGNATPKTGDKTPISPKQVVESKQAVALNYDADRAPFVSAKGTDEIAEQIIAVAREHGVPLYENAELVKSLAQLELGDEIPELLYRVIAEIIAFAYYIQGKTPQGFGDTAGKSE